MGTVAGVCGSAVAATVERHARQGGLTERKWNGGFYIGIGNLYYLSNGCYLCVITPQLGRD